MIRMHFTQALALSTFVFLSSAVAAQITFDPRLDRGGARESDDCQRAVGASRTRSRCEREPEPAARTTVQQEIKVSIEVPVEPSNQCEATSTTEYQQRNTVARVNTALAVAGCAAAAGGLTVTARIRDAGGEVKSLEFNETWQRSGDQEVAMTADYPIGENVDLLSVRVRQLTCTCAEAVGAEAAGPVD